MKIKKKPINQKTRTYTLTDVQIRQLKEDAKHKAIDTAFVLMLSMPVMVMRDKHGWGQVRLERFTDQILDLYEAFNEDYITFEDLIKTLEAETGIKLSYKDQMERRKERIV